MSFNNSILFTATTVHLDHITTALSCLVPFGAKEDVLIIIDEEGLSFASEKSHIIKIHLFLSKDLFTLYNYDSSRAPFEKVCVKLNHILDSVSVASRDRDDIMECTLSYNGDGTPFIFILEDSVITERMEYSTYLIRDQNEYLFNNEGGLQIDPERVEYECIIQGDVLWNSLQDLRELGCKDCYLYVSSKPNAKPQFTFIFKNEQLGISRISLPNGRSIIEKIEFNNNQEINESISYFDFHIFDKISKSVKIASKVLFRKDTNGILSVNILSKTSDIINSDKFRGSNNTNKKSRSKGNMLPKDYSGIVIDITMVEKATETSFEDLLELINRSPSKPVNQKSSSKKKRKLNDDGDQQQEVTSKSNKNVKPPVSLFF